MNDTPNLTPQEQRLRDVVHRLYVAIPDDVRDECQALADLSPEDAGIRVALHPDDDRVDFVWVDRLIGSTSYTWLMTGTLPSTDDA